VAKKAKNPKSIGMLHFVINSGYQQIKPNAQKNKDPTISERIVHSELGISSSERRAFF